MRASDRLLFAVHSLSSSGTRTLLMLLALSVGVASVVMLTALGEGARRYVQSEFTALGSHLLIVLPGRSETAGGAPPLMGETPRDLTLQDASALIRSASVGRVAPVVVGAAPVAHGGREREATVVGTNHEFARIRHLRLAAGAFLPESAVDRAIPVCVLGATLARELTGRVNAVGEFVRFGDRRMRVIGVLASEGRSLGMDLDELAIVPVATAQALFNAPGLFRVLVEARAETLIPAARRHIIETIRARHEGEDDVTVITQDALISTFGRVLGGLTIALGGIAGISLAVAGVLIMNVMLVAVSQRVSEVGLLKSIGASSRLVRELFLVEAILLATTGALLGLCIGLLLCAVTRWLLPALQLVPPLWALLAAPLVAIAFGVLFGVLPARRAAALAPVQALARRG
ncbi:MAG: ABC transporter permease [Gammaproteobacteria bacterium]|nr:ABC transporter permease [Gammaproteobacteria bacterium]